MVVYLRSSLGEQTTSGAELLFRDLIAFRNPAFFLFTFSLLSLLFFYREGFLPSTFCSKGRLLCSLMMLMAVLPGPANGSGPCQKGNGVNTDF